MHTTPYSIDPIVREFCASTNPNAEPIYVPVQAEPDAKALFCTKAVPKKVAADGGEVVSGWAIWKSPELIEAEFHLVWKSPTGNLIDVTPKPDGEKEILFLPQDIVFDGSKPIPNIRKPLGDTLNTRYAMERGQIMDRLREKYWTKDGAMIPLDELAKVEEATFQAMGGHQVVQSAKVGRNDPCPCGSGKKFKRCHYKP